MKDIVKESWVWPVSFVVSAWTQSWTMSGCFPSPVCNLISLCFRYLQKIKSESHHKSWNRNKWCQSNQIQQILPYPAISPILRNSLLAIFKKLFKKSLPLRSKAYQKWILSWKSTSDAKATKFSKCFHISKSSKFPHKKAFPKNYQKTPWITFKISKKKEIKSESSSTLLANPLSEKKHFRWRKTENKKLTLKC